MNNIDNIEEYIQNHENTKNCSKKEIKWTLKNLDLEWVIFLLDYVRVNK